MCDWRGGIDSQISMPCNSYVIITWSCLVLVTWKVRSPKNVTIAIQSQLIGEGYGKRHLYV